MVKRFPARCDQTPCDGGALVSVIGVDIGGTKTLIVRLNEAWEVESQRTVPTPDADATELSLAIAEHLSDDLDGAVSCVGVCLPGMVDVATGTLAYAPKPAIRQADIRGRLRTLLPCGVVVSNDANAATWAEFCLGAGRGAKTVLGVFVGTGVGLGVVTNGELLLGAHGFAAEVGMMTVGVQSYGRLRQLGSGSAIGERGRATIRRLQSEGYAAYAGLDVDSLTGEDLMHMAQAGDQAATDAFTRVAEDLGSGVGILINLFDPTVVVVGGGAAESGDLLLAPLRRSAERHLYAAEERPRIPVVAARLGSAASAMGAAHLAAISDAC